jgi:hypothetical protein
MKGALLIVSVLLASLVCGVFEAAAQSTSGKKLLHAVVAKSKGAPPTTKFTADDPKIYALWKGDTLKAGDKVHAVWIAEAFGPSSKDVRIMEGSVTAYKPDDDGVFALTSPEGGWPAGRYRVEFYVGDKLAEAVRFTIEPGATIEVR